MDYFLDTEFVEDGSAIMPISIGIVAEDGRELYLELQFDEDKARAHNFVREHVLPHLRTPRQCRVTKEQARKSILGFIGDDPSPQFWAYYADYDWVLICQLFGTMIDLPERFPKFCMDLQQWYVRLGRPNGVKPTKPKNVHNALADAKWNLEFYHSLNTFDPKWNDIELLQNTLDVIERADPQYKTMLEQAIDEVFSSPESLAHPMSAEEFRTWLHSKIGEE